MKKLIITIIIATIVQSVSAATFNTFSNGSWTEAAQWTAGSFPGSVSGRNLTLSGSNTINVNHTIEAKNNVILNGKNNLELNVNPDADLTIAGDLIVPQNMNPKLNVVGTATQMAYLTIKGNLEANAQLEITVENGVLRIEGNMLGANNANIKLNVLKNGVLYIKENLDLNNNVNFSFDGEGTILIDGDMDMQGFNSNPLDGIIAVLGSVRSSTNIQKKDAITLWGDNFTGNSVGNDARKDAGIPGPAQGTYEDFANGYPVLCAYSDYCNSTYNAPAPPLPVTFVKVDATATNQEVIVTWSTAQEENNEYFEVERSLDAKTWEYVGAVEGAGNSKDLVEYELIDNVTTTEVVYYRIKQTDYDGQFAYSDVVYVASEILTKELMAGVYPNPNRGTFFFELSSEDEEVYSVLISSIEGNVMSMSFINAKNILKLTSDNEILSGFYTLVIKTNKQSYHSSFIAK